MTDILSSPRLSWVVAACLAIPLLFLDPSGSASPRLGWPQIYSGDEPHYLALIHSIVDDGDLDLANQYRSAHAGGPELGGRFSGKPVAHHTVWFEDDRRIKWDDVYEPRAWQIDAEGHPYPIPRTDPPGFKPGHKEYPYHPVAFGFLLAPLMFLIGRKDLVEPLTIACCCLALVGGLFLFRSMLRECGCRERGVTIALILTFLATPVWHYGRTLFSEGFLTLTVTGAFALVLRGRWLLLAGALMGTAVLLKPPLIGLAVPLLGVLLFRRQYRPALLFSAILACFCVLLLHLNARMFGSPLRTPLLFERGSTVEGLAGLLFSLHHGVFLFSPVAVVSLILWPRFLRNRPAEAVTLGLGFLIYLGIMASWRAWDGGYCYGPRLIVPALPLLMAPLGFLPDVGWLRGKPARAAVLILACISIGINAAGSILSWKYWDKHPVAHHLGRRL